MHATLRLQMEKEETLRWKRRKIEEKEGTVQSQTE